MSEKTIFAGGDWKSLDDVARDFHIPRETFEGAEVLFALYNSGGYDGSAVVILRRNGKLYRVDGGHCSCYGLEDQWQEDETSVEALKHEYADLESNTKIYDDDDKVALLRLLDKLPTL